MDIIESNLTQNPHDDCSKDISLKKPQNIESSNCKNDIMTRFQHQRLPKVRPDLKLAESYLPAFFLWVKGMLYTTFCLSIQYTEKDEFYQDIHHNTFLTLKVLPLLALYYDHLVTNAISNNSVSLMFIDSSSFAVDVVAATIATQLCHLDVACSGMFCVSVVFIWCMMGVFHVHYFVHTTFNHHYNVPLHGNTHLQIKTFAGHFLVCLFILCIFMFHDRLDSNKGYYGNNFNINNTSLPSFNSLKPMKTKFYFTYLTRSTAYLFFVTIDSYMFRLPTQRDRDRICTFRYGSILFSPASIMAVNILMLMCIQMHKIYQIMSIPFGHDMGLGDIHSIHGNIEYCPPCTMKKSGNVMNFKQTTNIKRSDVPLTNQIIGNLSNNVNFPLDSSIGMNKTLLQVSIPLNNSQTPMHDNSINFNQMDVNEAFRLAKLQYSENKATV